MSCSPNRSHQCIPLHVLQHRWTVLLQVHWSTLGNYESRSFLPISICLSSGCSSFVRLKTIWSRSRHASIRLFNFTVRPVGWLHSRWSAITFFFAWFHIYSMKNFYKNFVPQKVRFEFSSFTFNTRCPSTFLCVIASNASWTILCIFSFTSCIITAIEFNLWTIRGSRFWSSGRMFVPQFIPSICKRQIWWIVPVFDTMLFRKCLDLFSCCI